ncbi:hypothetical protein EIN_266050 [Entamoeba invadens IP1]|uniref:Leucine rich repeat containing protein BspA family protein n=1 Tax=Entamoeba invadens IP1 TaxID=370355 RepID=A0A0A1TWW9_ENTIV|nr:hypothetical protein EIN_266050 [Entamoeba invadens IP1]ELP85716.1 hypothetical protein EIN_266050 [Entamoeba invadens IP1]|eukprot:XP_004185062.1 hypothetical protein EIN_266050 [Entamoeba invadens IP1]
MKIVFYQIVVWFTVDYTTFDTNSNINIEFKNVIYTDNDKNKYGNNLPPNVTSLGKWCFYNCIDLSNVLIPLSVTSLGDEFFNGCNLSSVVISSKVISLGIECLIYCGSLVNVTIPPSVKSIGDLCFCSCCRLSSVLIPSSMKSIGDFCFSECDRLTSVVIPHFINCSNTNKCNYDQQ